MAYLIIWFVQFLLIGFRSTKERQPESKLQRTWKIAESPMQAQQRNQQRVATPCWSWKFIQSELKIHLNWGGYHNFIACDNQSLSGCLYGHQKFHECCQYVNLWMYSHPFPYKNHIIAGMRAMYVESEKAKFVSFYLQTVTTALKNLHNTRLKLVNEGIVTIEMIWWL